MEQGIRARVSLAHLPPEVLAFITNYLWISDVGRLLLSGDAILAHRLRNGGVVAVNVPDISHTASAPTVDNLQTLSSTTHTSGAHPTSWTAPFVRSFLWQAEGSPAAFAAHFPNLNTIETSYIGYYGIGKMLSATQGLHLTSFTLHTEMKPELMSPAYFPPTLTHLSFNAARSSDKILNFQHLPNLLSLHVEGYSPTLQAVPSTLTSLSLLYSPHYVFNFSGDDYDWRHLPKGLLNWRLVATDWEISPTHISKLPQNLKSLVLISSPTKDWDHTVIAALPRHLTELRLMMVPLTRLAPRDAETGSVGKLELPPNLVYLEFKGNAEHYPVDHLPQSLTELTANIGSIADPTLLPPGLSGLYECTISPSLLHLLPKYLTAAEFTLRYEDPIEESNFLGFFADEEGEDEDALASQNPPTSLPPYLTRLKLTLQTHITLGDIFPATLTHLTIITASVTGNFSWDYFNNLPSKLRSLTLNTSVLLDETQVQHLSRLSCLESLMLEGRQYFHSKLFKLLPQTIRILKLRVMSAHLHESDFADLPRSVRTLFAPMSSIDGEGWDCTPAVLQLLPPLLTRLFLKARMPDAYQAKKRRSGLQWVGLTSATTDIQQ